MMNKTLFIFITALFSSAAAMTSYAGDAPAAGGAASGGFEAIDADANGVITSDEAQANTSLIGNWSTLDTNQDGQLDAAEFSAFEIVPPDAPTQ